MRFFGLMVTALLLPVGARAQEIQPGTISVVASQATTTDPATTALFVEAVTRAILPTGFVPLPQPGHSRYVATVTVSQASRGLVVSQEPQSRSSSKLTYRGGAGVSLDMPADKARLRDLIETRLTVSVALRSGDHMLWNGQAVTVRTGATRAGDPDVVAKVLSDALFARFPDRLAEPISVP